MNRYDDVRLQERHELSCDSPQKPFTQKSRFVFPVILVVMSIADVPLRWGTGPGLIVALVGAILLMWFLFLQSISLAREPVVVPFGFLFCLIPGQNQYMHHFVEQVHQNAQALANALAVERARFEALLKVVPQTISIHDSTGKLLRFSHAERQERNPDLSLLEALGITELRNLAGILLQEDDLPVARALRGEPEPYLQMHAYDEAGVKHFLEMRAAPFSNIGGQIAGVVAYTSDITAFHQAEQHITECRHLERSTQETLTVLAGSVAKLATLILEREQLLHEQAEAQARILELATSDPLTGLPNHRTMLSLLNQELERAYRYSRSCSILFFDVDHFKALNDGYGHTVGDAVLYEFASLLRTMLRSIDTVGRWGGEEFVAILPEMPVKDALTCAERVRAAVSAHIFNVGGGIHLTCSVGVASYPMHAEERKGLIAAADHAMYGAKHCGRDQVRVANDPAILALFSQRYLEGGREEATLVGIVQALTSLMEARDPSASLYCQQVADFLLKLALAIGLPASEAQMIALAGRLHDVGNVVVPDAVLHKPDHLTGDEWKLIQKHPIVGAAVVNCIPALRPLAPIIRAHHERWDGQGYPDHLKAEMIPFGARLLAVTDAYLAMTVEQPSQQAHSRSSALVELCRGAGSLFDPQVVEIVERLLMSGRL